MKYVLASSSPRRKELMHSITDNFIIDVSNVDETVNEKLTPIETVKVIALRKGEEVRKRHPEDLVISADTIVVIDDLIIGKPSDKDDAIRILNLLNNRTHYVYTAYCLFYKGKIIEDVVESEVEFNNLDQKLIISYVNSGSPLDKAGAYGVQDNEKFPIVKKIKGSLTNVIGFPVEEIKEKINSLL